MKIAEKAKKVKEAERILRTTETKDKNTALLQIARSLKENKETILSDNARDVQAAKKNKVKASLIDRLALNPKRIDGMITACENVAGLNDPVGEVIKSWVQNGLRISQIRVPIGAIGMVYESRPNVTLDATILALKTGNPVLLRGGSDAIYSNLSITRAIKEGLSQSGLPETAVEIIEDTDRENVREMLTANQYLSLIIPRGGAGLIKFVVENSTVPVIETGVGNCHIFVDKDANIAKSVAIIKNAKTQRPGTCNSVETLLVHEKIAPALLPSLKSVLKESNVEIRGCGKTSTIIDVKKAEEDDWREEFLDYILAVKVVKSTDEAIEHIQQYSSGHSEAILTENYFNAMRFTNALDSAAVYVNASTRYTDGEQFGFGGEIGISTQKLHARGPVGLRELTSYKYIVLGHYHVRT